MSSSTTAHNGPIDIGARLEPMIDDFLIAELTDPLELRLHPPVKREVVLQTDAPCEGNACLYRTVFQDRDGRFRMYYGAWHYVMGGGRINYPHPYYVCYAESTDGKRWSKPDLGLVEFEGNRNNNIVLAPDSFPGIDISAGDTAVFPDTNPACQEGSEYKAIVPAGARLPFRLVMAISAAVLPTSAGGKMSNSSRPFDPGA